jgi:uncharacterized protein YpmS
MQTNGCTTDSFQNLYQLRIVMINVTDSERQSYDNKIKKNSRVLVQTGRAELSQIYESYLKNKHLYFLPVYTVTLSAEVNKLQVNITKLQYKPQIFMTGHNI